MSQTPSQPQVLQAQVAQALMRKQVTEFRERLEIEAVDIFSALGRVLALDIISPIDVPAANNSAMDGFALSSIALRDLQVGQVQLKIKDIFLAGRTACEQANHSFNPLKDSYRIMTGAVIPNECDTVIPQELVKVRDNQVTFSSSEIKPFANIRLRGEDLKKNSVSLNAGKILTPSDLGLIASLGIGTIKVKRRLKVAFFSTGNEICSIGENQELGQIFDSNRYTIFGMLTRLEVELIDLGIVKDDPVLLRETFKKAIDLSDVVITSGGVSVGQADFTKQIMQELGNIDFWKLAIKPGKPMAFGKLRSRGKESVLFGLPGNPVAVMITFYQFVRAALLWMSGALVTNPPQLQAKLSVDFKKKPGRTEFIRGLLSQDAQSNTWVTPHENQGAGILHSMSQADCLIILKHEQGDISKGTSVDITVFEGLL